MTIAPDAASLAEELVREMMARARDLDIDAGDVAAMLALELVVRLVLYGRATMPVVLAELGEAARIRESLMRAANRRNEPSPPLSHARMATVAPDACRLN